MTAMVSITRRRWLASAAAVPLAALPLDRIKLGVTTDEIDDDPAAAAKFLREFNLNWAEIRNVWGKYNTAQPLEKIHELRGIFDAHKIQTSTLGTAFFKIPLPMETPEGRATLDNQWALLNSAFERAKIMGTTRIRTFAFTYQGSAADPKHYPRIYELVAQAARMAGERGFQLALENVGSSYVSTGAEAANLLKAVQHPALGLTWDPNNAGLSGEQAYPDGYRKLDPARIIHVHLRDYRKAANGQKGDWTAVGEGEMDNLGQIRDLLKAGYRGTFTLETHYKSPLGKAHASRTSLTALLKVIDKV
ncbi:MAG: sugar phosphate isomerase/epimerase [Acidobacteria bacterium]|nr:sugar phosphate isomerase/epimerase [Acidobacteriota bacterium]